MDALIDYFHKNHYSDLNREQVANAMQDRGIFGKALDFIRGKHYPDIHPDVWAEKQRELAKAHALIEQNKGLISSGMQVDNPLLYEDIMKKVHKGSYINYLNSDYYRQTVQKTFGNNSDEVINNQIDTVRNTPIRFLNDLEIGDKIKYMTHPNGVAAWYSPRNKDITFPLYGSWDENNDLNLPVNNTISHELSHATDAPLNLPTDLFVTKYKELEQPTEGIRSGGTISLPYDGYNTEKYSKEEIDKYMSNTPEVFKKWKDYFKVKDNISNSIEYLSDPTEIRARVNSLRNQMLEDNFNWNNASDSQINEYMDKALNKPGFLKNAIYDLREIQDNSNIFKNKINLYDVIRDFASVNNNPNFVV